jgi:hypothetical protein
MARSAGGKETTSSNAISSLALTARIITSRRGSVSWSPSQVPPGSDMRVNSSARSAVSATG